MLDDNENTTTPATSPEGAPDGTGGAGTPPDSPESSGRPQAAADSPGDVPTGDVPPGDGSAQDAATDAAQPPARKTAKRATAKKAAKRPARKSTATDAAASAEPADVSAPAPTDGSPATAGDQDEPAGEADASARPTKKTARKSAKKTSSTTAKKTGARKSAKKVAPAAGSGADTDDAPVSATDQPAAPVEELPAGTGDEPRTGRRGRRSAPPATSLVFQAPDPAFAPTSVDADADAEDEEEDAQVSLDAATGGADDVDTTPVAADDAPDTDAASDTNTDDTDTDTDTDTDDDEDTDEDEDDESGGSESGGPRRRRRRGGRRRRRSGGGGGGDADSTDSTDGSESSEGSDDTGSVTADASEDGSGDAGTGRSRNGAAAARNKAGSEAAASDDGGSDSGEGSGSRRRRRRRRTGEDSGNGGGDDPQNTTTRVRKTRNAEDEITSLQGSTRLEAKKQRRREGREAGRRRAPIVSEAEFLARREAVDRVMVIRQHEDLTQIAVLEDKVLVEHYVARESQTSLIGNVYLGRVQNVLPSMEAAFIDIGKGRNAVLYAGEVNWDSLGAGNGPRKIEQVLKSGQPILVQVTKDPIGHKGARLTSQVSLPGRFLVYVPDGTTSGISRKLPDTERSRLKTLLKEIVPESAGVIVRTAAEGASEEELTRDVERLTARWSDIESKVEKGNAPALLYGEPDLTLKVVRDLFTEDFGKLVVSGDDAWDMVDEYVKHVAPELEPRLEHYAGGEDVFAAYRIDEQIAKGLDRKVWLPSGGSLIIDRTEAMTVVDVNTGKFTGSGGNLEETVTKNNLEAAEEIVRQLRLRDIGGIIVVDFIDMVLESNRDLVLRRLVECLGRDRTRHQVAEVTSLGLVQMTRKRIGTGLLEAFSETCEHCGGRGLIVHHEPVESRKRQEDEPRRGRRNRRGGDGAQPADNGNGNGNGRSGPPRPPSPADLAAMAKHESKQLQDDLVPLDGDPDGDPGRTPEVTDGSTADGAPEVTAGSTSQSGSGATADAATAATTDVGTEATADAGRTNGAAASTEGFDVVHDADALAVSGDGADGTGSPEPSDGAGTPGSRPADAGSGSGSEPVAAPAQPAVPAGPRLVTSRRRVARRPAGPPVGADGAGSASTVAVTTRDDVTADAHETSAEDLSVEEAAAAETAHVPVKKKGGRKH